LESFVEESAMTTIYEYDSLPGVPCLPFIQTRIAYGVVGSRDVEGISWEGAATILRIEWKTPLDSAKKALLDSLVQDSVGKVQVSRSREDIVNDIFWSCYSDPAQLGRLLNAFDVVPSMALALDNLNYALARSRVAKCYDDGLITDADRDLLLAKIPENEFA
jgi:hypothetical protein